MTYSDEPAVPAAGDAPANAATSPEPAAATAFVPAKVTIDRTFQLPSITFCLARHSQSDRIFCGGADFALHHFQPAVEKPETRPLGELKHNSYVTGVVNAGGTLISGG